VKGLLNVFGIYDYTNDRMFTHCYKHKKSDRFIDLINRVDSLYDSSIKRIYMLLDNSSIHNAKKTREALAHHPRIVSVFLPSYKIARTQSDRGKMDVVDAKESHR
jgi:hypothetical protein